MGLSLEFADDSEELNETELFRSVGELGLECLHYYAMHEENFHSVVLEQQARPEDRRCPIGRASAECVKVLYDHYKISQSASRGSSHFQPFMLNFPRLHSLVLKFFLRMWQDSESRLDDFERLSYLVTSQVRLTLANEHTKTWLNLENDFLGTDYRNIRDGQMEMIDKEDGLLERAAVNDLREKVRREAYEVVSDQRLLCMMQGSWFNAAHVLVPGIEQASRPTPSKPLRFVRLSQDQQTLHWGEFVERSTVPPSYEQLKYKSGSAYLLLADPTVDLDDVTEVHVQTGCAIGSRSPDLVSKLSISLMSGPNLSLLDIDAIHAQQFAEWTDGLLVLKGQSEMGTQESNNYVHVSSLRYLSKITDVRSLPSLRSRSACWILPETASRFRSGSTLEMHRRAPTSGLQDSLARTLSFLSPLGSLVHRVSRASRLTMTNALPPFHYIILYMSSIDGHEYNHSIVHSALPSMSIPPPYRFRPRCRCSCPYPP